MPPPRAPSRRRSAWRILRGCARLSWIAVLTLALALLWHAGLPFRRGPGPRRAWRRRIFGAWSRGLLAAVGARVVVRGAPPGPPCFLVLNHQGWLEILALAATSDSVFVSMGEIRGWPLIGYMARAFGTILIDRAHKRGIPGVQEEMLAAFGRGERVVFFPESRTMTGARVERFAPALFEVAARGPHPVGWAAANFRTGPHDAPAAESVSFARKGFRAYAAGLLALDEVEVEIVHGEGVLREQDRKELALAAHARVSALFRPLAGSESA